MKRHRPAWEINFAVKGGPLVVHLSLSLWSHLQWLPTSTLHFSELILSRSFWPFCLRLEQAFLPWVPPQDTLILYFHSAGPYMVSEVAPWHILPSLEVMLPLLALHIFSYYSSNKYLLNNQSHSPNTILDTSVNDNKVFEWRVYILISHLTNSLLHLDRSWSPRHFHSRSDWHPGLVV